MKRIIGFALSWALYGIGDASNALRLNATYITLMNFSASIQDWGGAGPWKAQNKKV